MIERLRSALGDEAVRHPAHDTIRFGGRKPGATVAPADVDQAVAAIRICAENGWTILPAGGMTWLHAGFTGPADVLLSSERLAGIIEYEPADLAVAAYAGTTLAELDGAARANAQFFPVQPPATARATVGGAIATAAAGPLRLGYGTPRDHVLGLQIVTGDGRRLDLGGRVVKNVAGYDMVRLMVGSRGSLGFITRAFLRLRPRPASDITAVLRAPDPGPLHHAARAIMDTWPVAAELLAPATTARLLPGPGWALAVRWQGNTSYAEYVKRRIKADNPALEVISADLADGLWTGLARLEAQQSAGFHLTTRPDLLPTALEAGRTLIDYPNQQSDKRLGLDRDGRWHMAAHARSGLVRIWSDAASVTDLDTLRSGLSSVRQQVTESVAIRTLVLPAVDQSGAWSGTDPGHTPGMQPAVSSGTDPLADGDPDRIRSLMQGIRHAFDPWHIFAPDPTVEPA